MNTLEKIREVPLEFVADRIDKLESTIENIELTASLDIRDNSQSMRQRLEEIEHLCERVLLDAEVTIHRIKPDKSTRAGESRSND